MELRPQYTRMGPGSFGVGPGCVGPCAFSHSRDSRSDSPRSDGQWSRSLQMYNVVYTVLVWDGCSVAFVDGRSAVRFDRWAVHSRFLCPVDTFRRLFSLFVVSRFPLCVHAFPLLCVYPQCSQLLTVHVHYLRNNIIITCILTQTPSVAISQTASTPPIRTLLVMPLSTTISYSFI